MARPRDRDEVRAMWPGQGCHANGMRPVGRGSGPEAQLSTAPPADVRQPVAFLNTSMPVPAPRA